MLVMNMLPGLLVMLMPEPAVSVASVKLVPLPIGSCPLLGMPPWPVPPLPTDSGVLMVTLPLLLMRMASP